MNGNIDLTKILVGCEGIELYSTIHGKVILRGIGQQKSFPICVETEDKGLEFFTKEGLYLEFLGECILFPSKDQRDWNKFVRPIPVDTPMMCSRFGDYFWELCYYSMFYNGKHRCFYKGCTSKNADPNNKTGGEWSYMIPFDKFDPNNIEESLKYNINAQSKNTD